MSGEVAGPQSPGCCANHNTVPHPSGSTKDCNSYPVHTEDESEEEDDDDADTAAGTYNVFVGL